MYSAYAREALAVDNVVSRVWRVYLLGYKCFSIFTDHAALTHLLKQPNDKLIDRQVHRVERLIPFAQRICIIYRT